MMKMERILYGLTFVGLITAPVLAQDPPPDTTSFVMSDFENGRQTTPFWGYWYTYTDGKEVSAADTALFGNSMVTSIDSNGQNFTDSLGSPDDRTFPKGHDSLSLNCQKFGYVLGSRKLSCGGTCNYEAHVGFGTGFTTQAQSLDMTGATSISFWAKADTAPLIMSVAVGTIDTVAPNASDYSQLFSITTAWKEYKIFMKPSADLKQPTWSVVKSFNTKAVKGLGFGINRGDNPDHPTNAVYVDDVTIQNWRFIEPPVIIDSTPVDTVPIDTATIGIKQGLANANSKHGFSAKRIGDSFLVQLPSSYNNHQGTVEAVTVRGNVVARAAFGIHANQVTMNYPHGLPSHGLYFRVILGSKSH
jgi:hypothetical protein